MVQSQSIGCFFFLKCGQGFNQDRATEALKQSPKIQEVPKFVARKVDKPSVLEEHELVHPKHVDHLQLLLGQKETGELYSKEFT